MTHVTYSFQSFDGLRLFAQSWAPDQPRAAISLVHGIGDHSNRYPAFVQSLTATGYAINAFDLRGHGHSQGPRVHTPTYDALLRDIDIHLENTRQRFPNLPHILYGHSFGAAQVLCYILKRRPTPPTLAAVVASSPGLASGIRQAPLKILAARILSRLAPALRLPLGCPINTLSTDPAWVAQTLQDPDFQTTISARCGIEMLKTNQWLLSQTHFPLPLLIQQGTADQYVDPATNIAFAQGLQGPVTLKIWPGLGHELHNELPQAQVLAFVRTWLDGLNRLRVSIM